MCDFVGGPKDDIGIFRLDVLNDAGVIVIAERCVLLLNRLEALGRQVFDDDEVRGVDADGVDEYGAVVKMGVDDDDDDGDDESVGEAEDDDDDGDDESVDETEDDDEDDELPVPELSSTVPCLDLITLTTLDTT